MTETTTPTEEVVNTPVGSEASDLPADNTNESAVEQVNGTATQETAEPGTNDSTNEEEPTEATADLKKFAKGQGYTDEDLEDLSPREIKALDIARKQVSDTRKKMQSEAKDGVAKTINTVQGKDMSDRDYFEFKLAQRDMVDSVRDYWTENPDDRKYEVDAVAILEREKQEYGEEAMFRLANNMPRLVREAKYAAGAFDSEAISEKARREERERLNRLQSGAADGMDARTTETPNNDVINQEWVKNTYDPSNPEHRVKLDAFLASRGKVY